MSPKLESCTNGYMETSRLCAIRIAVTPADSTQHPPIDQPVYLDKLGSTRLEAAEPRTKCVAREVQRHNGYKEKDAGNKHEVGC